MAIIRKQDKQESVFRTKISIINRIEGAYRQVLSIYNDLNILIFQNPEKLTPEEVLKSFEGDGEELLHIYTVTGNALKQLNPDNVREIPLELSVDVDGSIKIEK